MSRPEELSVFDRAVRRAGLVITAAILLSQVILYFVDTIGENYRLIRENAYLRQEIDEWREAMKRQVEERKVGPHQGPHAARCRLGDEVEVILLDPDKQP